MVFPNDDVLTEVKVGTLQVGDYRALFTDGTPSKVVFERKSLADLWGTMTRGHQRFKREMEKAEELGVELVLIVECQVGQIRAGFDRSEFSGDSMLKKLGTLWHKYGLQTVFCEGRRDMAEYILWRFKSEGYNRVRSLQTVVKTDTSNLLISHMASEDINNG